MYMYCEGQFVITNASLSSNYSQLEAFSKHLVFRNVAFSAAGFFEIDLKLITSVSIAFFILDVYFSTGSLFITYNFVSALYWAVYVSVIGVK